MNVIGHEFPQVLQKGKFKYILESELHDHYLLTLNNDLVNILINFFKNGLKDWTSVVQFVEEDNDYLKFEYKDYKELNMASMLTKHRPNLKSVLTSLHNQTLQTKFMYNDQEYYIGPNDNYYKNFMIDEEDNIVMIDVDSFRILRKDAIKEMLYITFRDSTIKI